MSEFKKGDRVEIPETSSRYVVVVPEHDANGSVIGITESGRYVVLSAKALTLISDMVTVELPRDLAIRATMWLDAGPAPDAIREACRKALGR